MSGYSFKVEKESNLARALCDLIKYADKNDVIVTDLDKRDWNIYISFSSYGLPGSAYCEAYGTPAKAQLIINLYNHATKMYTWGCFNRGVHKLVKAQGKAESVFAFLKSELLNISEKYEELCKSVTKASKA